MPTPYTADSPIQPLGLVGDKTVQPIPNIETRTEEQLFQDINTPTGAKPVQPDAATPAPADPFAGFQDANFDSFQDAPDQFANFKTADDLDLKSVEDLNKARDTFHPADYFASNPDVARDPKKLQKLLEVYRKRDEEGLTAKGVASAAIKNTPGLVGDIAGGVKRLGERAIDVAVQPIANVVLGTLTGDLFDEQKRNALFNETRKVIKKGVAETGAGTEAATVGLVDLARTGARKIEPGSVSGGVEGLGIGQVGEKFVAPKPKTDQELLAQLSDDASFRQVADSAIKGEGEAAKNFGLDKETLAAQGITLDENAIRQLSLVDPITMVAAGGAFKLVGTAGKVIGVARSLEGAQALAGKLAEVAKASRTARFVGGTLEKVGNVAAETKGFSGRGLSTVGALIGTAGGGSKLSGAVGAGVAKVVTKGLDIFALPALKKAGATIEQAGKLVAGESAAGSSAGAQRLAELISGGVVTPLEAAAPAAKTIGKGAVEGIAAAAPFAVAAQDDETAGSLLGAGAALGAAGAAGAGAFRVVKDSAARHYFGENRPILPDVPSPAYGKDAALDAQHEANIQKLSAQDASELNNFREALRQQGGEIYAVDAPTFRQKMQEIFPDITPEQLDTYANHSAFFDTNLGDRKVVYLNSDTTGLKHDAGHIFDAVLSPEKRAELRSAVEDAFTPEQRKAFRDTYERRVGNKISDTAAVDEFIAEQFSALFNNVPVTELAAPKTLLNKFIDTVAQGAEALGIDLSNGATTPNLGAPVNVGIRQLFRNAAGDVIRANIEGVPAKNVVSPDFGGNPPPPSGGVPVPAAPRPPSTPPGNVVPLTPARPIRTTPEAPPNTPEARAAAAKRFEVSGIGPAKELAAKLADPVGIKAVEDISAQMGSGNPVLEVEHLGIKSEGTPDSPEGRTSRRATQAAGYEALKGELSRAGAPEDLVNRHIKTFVPVRWEPQGGSPTLIAMSLDKVLTNLKEIAQKAADANSSKLIPYPVENGKFTPEGWREAVSDFQKYAENQANGRKGDGGRLTVPEAGELSIPVENPSYTPQPLSPEKADFANLVQGLGTPATARAIQGKIPGNVKGQLLAEANKRPVELPSNLPIKQRSKQAFKEFPPRVVKEVNPLRNRMKEAGVDISNLHEVTERIRAQDIEKVTPRPDLNFSAPVTDTIRGGFLPAPTEFRSKNLQGRTVEEFSDYVLKSSPAEFKAATENMTGGLTGGAWNLGLGLKDAADVEVLKSYQSKFSESAKAAMQAGDFDAAYSAVSKGQFFREAYEAATGTGSAGAAFKRGTMGTESAKPPFPVVEKTQGTVAAGPETKPINVGESGQFLPKTESGRALEEKGFEIKPLGFLGTRGVEIFDKDKNLIGEIISSQVNPGEANIANVLVRKPVRGQGVGETLYRELAAQLKEDGVTKVTGDVVAPEPLNIRRKVFGEFSDLKVNGKPADFQDASAAARLVQKGLDVHHIEPTNLITPESSFLPAEQLNVGTSEQQAPDLKIVPAAAGSGTPPKSPSQLRPPPVAIVSAQQDENKAGFLPKPDEDVRNLAKTYTADAGLTYAPKGGYAEVKPDLAKRLADFYDAAKSDPNDPAVKASYDALIRETEDQGKAILAAGYKIEPWTGEGEPYKNSAEAIADVRDNKHLFFRKTEGAFAGTADNPMLAESSIVPGQSVNDVFRWVHDFFGHAKEGYQFGPRGEFNAWKSHSEMYSPEAQGALAAETLAQNSWVNFGKHLEGKDIPQAERPFAEQKNIVIPKELINEASFLPKGKRDAQGRPLDKEGNIDYVKWQAESLAARRKREAAPIAEATPGGPATEDFGPITGWILPDKKFVPLDTNFHEQYLAENAASLNEKFKTNFSETASPDDRLAALNAGFVRLRNQNGQLRVEINSQKFPSVKSKLLNVLQDREGQIDGLTVSLLNDKGVEVDSTSATRLHELTGPEKFNAISDAVGTLRGGRFSPSDESLPGFKAPPAAESPEQFLKEKTARFRKENPEAILPQYTHDENGKLALGSNGKPKPVAIEYNFASTPLVKAETKGLKGEARNAKAAEVLGDELVKVYNKAIKNPDIEAGSKWYSTARTRLKKVLGDDSKLFAELLGATSARTAVDVNFKFAVEAYNQFKSGAFDGILAKYREGKQAFDQGDIANFVKDTGNAEPNRGQFLSWWIEKNDLGPLQSNGKKFGMNSIPVLKVLDGSWASEVKGPKTPNFTGNLTGETFEATVDVWAARLLQRLGNQGNEGRWRILPENETGVTDADFYLGQAAFRHAADKLGIKPDSLQAILWFAEKDFYEKQGWTRSVGAAKSDFNVLLKRTEKTPEGKLKVTTAQKELDIPQGTLDITPKKK